MRILEVETFGRGGLTHYAYNLSCALAERGHEVTLVTTVAYELEERKLPANVRIREFYLPPGAELSVPPAQQEYISANYHHVGGVIA